MGKTKLLPFALAIFFVSAPVKSWGQQISTARPATQSPAVAADTSQEQGQPDDLQHRNPRYKIQREDVLSITFPLSPEFDQASITVQPDGYITLQGIGSLYVQDLTVPELVDTLKKAYSQILHDPIIDVDLLNFQKPYFLVEGQVGKPGQYDLRHETTVAEGIAMAGGFSSTAKTQVFLLHRVSPGWMEVKKLKMNDILDGKKTNEDTYLASGDMIVVPEKFITKFRKYVPYGLGTSVGYGIY